MNNFIDRKVEEFEKHFTVTSNANTPRIKRWVSIGWLKNVGGHYIDSNKTKHMVGSLYDADTITNFLRQALQEQKELIMSCLPKEKQYSLNDDSVFPIYAEGFNECRNQFIKNVEEKV